MTAIGFRSLFLAALPIAVILGLVQFAAWRRYRRPELLLWSLADGIGLCGAAMIGARGLLPWWISSTLGNTLMLAGGLLIWAGLRRSAGRRVPVLGFAMVTLLFFSGFHGLTLLTDDLGLRVLVASMATVLLNAATAADLVRMQPIMRPGLHELIVVTCVVYALFYLFRAGTAMTLDAGVDLLDTGGLQSFTVVLGTVKLLIWNFAVLAIAKSAHLADSDPTAVKP